MAKKQSEEYLNKFIGEQTSHLSDINENITDIRDNIINNSNIENKNTLGYLTIDMSLIPGSIFYKTGTQIKIRAATVSEVQAYSVVNNNSEYDITEKMNQILSSCIKVIYSNGNVGSYRDIKDCDRMVLIFMIRELTFQQGNTLAKDVKCKSCGHEFKIHYRATKNDQFDRSFEFYELDPKLEKYFDKETRTIKIKIGEIEYRLSPPTIGLQESFFTELKRLAAAEKIPNVSFMKIQPYLLYDRNSITEDGLIKKEDEFKNMNMETFQVLNAVVDKMKFGVKNLKNNCPKCGEEVHTLMSFPRGASSIFTISDPLEYLD